MRRSLCLMLSVLPSLALADAQMRVAGTEMVVTEVDGSELRGSALEGAELDLGALGSLRVRRHHSDPDARFPDETWLLEGELRALGASEFKPLCPPDPKGDARMLMFSGYLDGDLRYVDDRARFSMSCLSGVEAKCLRWGYHPWRKAPIGGESLAAHFETCIRLARADYCGNSHPTTRDGTSIDIYDRVGIQQRTPNLATYAFEAGWGPSGAVCVHHARIPENLALGELSKSCPRLKDAPVGAACDEALAIKLGALIVNRSVERSASLP